MNPAVPTYTTEEHAQYVAERDKLIDAARESARSFDQAVLAFGSALFGGSVAFLKDVAPHPASFTLPWLFTAWVLMAAGLLAVLLSFLYSHKACMFEINCGADALGKPEAERPKNRWAMWTTVCNYSCIGLLFLGLIFWSVFAFENLAHTEGTMNKPDRSQEDRGYVPPPPPPRTPPPPPTNQPAPQQSPKK